LIVVATDERTEPFYPYGKTQAQVLAEQD